MIHPHTELRMVSAIIGYGVFATRFIPKGTMTYVKDSLEIDLPEDHPMVTDPAYRDVIEKYSYVGPDGNRILSWDIAKYVNHACECNTMSTGWGFEVALRDIQAGEEITDEYGLFNLDEPMPIACGEANCRGVVRPDDALRFSRQWDQRIKGAMTGFSNVEQPLIRYLESDTHQDVLIYCNTGRRYRSVQTLARQRSSTLMA